jgi:penicillin-binding protein 1B
VIWIGFDDNRDLGLPGGAVAAPIWADFMTRATSLGTYRDVKDFTMPEGVQSVVIDPESLQLATANCPATREEVYVAGSAPTQFCEIHGGHGLLSSTGSFLSHVFGGQPKTPPADGTAPPAVPYDPNRPPNATGQGPAPADPSAQPGEKKKSALHKIFGIFGGKKKDPDKAKPKPEKGDPP